jgi:hypothetical protein
MRRVKARAVAMETRVWDTVTLAVFVSAVVYVLSIAGR